MPILPPTSISIPHGALGEGSTRSRLKEPELRQLYLFPPLCCAHDSEFLSALFLSSCIANSYSIPD